MRDPRYGYPPQMQQQQFQPPPPMLIPNPFATPQPSNVAPPLPPIHQQQQQYPLPQEYHTNEPAEEPPAWDIFLNN